MKKVIFGIWALLLTLPLGVQAETASRMTPEQLIQYAVDRNVCEGRSVASASYVSETDNRVAVTCRGPVGGVSETAGLGGLGGAGVAAAALLGVGIVALSAGGSSSTPDTQ